MKNFFSSRFKFIAASFVLLFSLIFSGIDYYLHKSPNSYNILELENNFTGIINTEQESLGEYPINSFLVKGDEEEVITIQQGDTFLSTLESLNIPYKEAYKASVALNKRHRLTSLKIGQDIYIKSVYEKGVKLIKEISIRLSNNTSILMKKEGDKFQVIEENIPLFKKLNHIQGSIQDNFYSSALKFGLPFSLLKEAGNTLTHLINTKKIQKGQNFDIVYEIFTDKKGKFIRSGSILYIGLQGKNGTESLYNFSYDGTSRNYYTDKGESIKKALFTLPIISRKVRISSHFTKGRRHPLLGYVRPHNGVDFAVPHGTPVVSVASGVVVKAGYMGGYGNCVRIRHPNGCETVYAHLSKISKKIRPGVIVKHQEQIGFVGSTGLATGAHLHYEVIKNKVPIDPIKYKQTEQAPLTKAQLTRFKAFKRLINDQFIQPKVCLSKNNKSFS